MRDLNRLHGMIGLCQRSGSLVSGTETVLKTIRTGKCDLALTDENASENTLKSIDDACAFYGVRNLKVPQGLLGDAIGKTNRMTAAVLDRGFADKLVLLILE